MLKDFLGVPTGGASLSSDFLLTTHTNLGCEDASV